MSLGEQSSQDTLGQLQGKGDNYTKLAIIEKKKLIDLQDAISYVDAQTDSFRERAKKSAIDVMNIHVLTPNPAYSRADGVNIAKEAHAVTTKTLIVLETKLNKLLQRQSEVQNYNKRTKDDINHFRLLRMQTDVSHSKFEAILNATKERIEAFLSESTKVVEERERTLEKIDALERQNVEEQQKFVEEYEEMGRYVKEQNSALEYALLQERKADMKARANAMAAERAAKYGQDKSPNQLAAKSSSAVDSQQLLNASALGIAVSDLSLEEEVEMAKKMGTLSAFLGQEQNTLADLKEKIATYENMFNQLKYMAGVDSLEEMVSSYIAHEEEMFSLYNFIQTVNAEIDAVSEATIQTEHEILRYRDEQQNQDQQRRIAIEELQMKLTSTQEVSRQIEQQNIAHQESINQIGKKVYTLFFKLQCDQMDAKGTAVGGSKAQRSRVNGNRPESKIALLTSQGVSESNVVDYLGCIEQRAVDIISEYLRIVHSTNPGPIIMNAPHTLVKFNTMAPRSPTPGPPSPMQYNNKREPVLDMNDLTDDEPFLGNDLTFADGTHPSETYRGMSTPMNLPSSVSPRAAMISMSSNPNMMNTAVESDSKPIDLELFKAKLSRKMGLKDNLSNSGLFNVHPKSASGGKEERKIASAKSYK